MPDNVRLLIPLDGSELAEHAIAYIPMLMPLGVTDVELVSVVAPAGERAGRERHLLETYQAELAEEIREQTALDVHTRILSGVPWAAIVEEAEAFRPDYLVISTHGASGMTRWRLGGVADKVVRNVSCPTLVVGPQAVEREERLQTRLLPAFEAILVPLDGSELAEQALPVAARFVEAFGAELHLVSVVSLGDLSTDSAWAGVSPRLDDEFSEEARVYLEDASARANLPGTVHLAVRFGAPADSLEDYVRDNDMDLVIMSSHGRGGLVRAALGSTTDRLLGNANAPLLIVRSQA
jgi:nucleotide-binding universal stress UspA family protein